MQLVVVSMHRSGSSVVTRLLNMMGAYFGAEGTGIGANEENSKGFWERRDIVALNTTLLSALHGDWHRLAQVNVEHLSETTAGCFQVAARNIITNLDAHSPWVAKDPRFCILFSFWRALLLRPIVVIVYRNPLEVALSLQTRNGFPLSFGVALWEKYTLEALRSTQGLPRLLVAHKEVMSHPVATVRRLYEALQALEVKPLRMPSAREINGFIDTTLMRAKATDQQAVAFLNDQQQALSLALADRSVLGWNEIPSLSALSAERLLTFERQLELTQKVEKLALMRKQCIATQCDIPNLRALYGNAQQQVESLKDKIKHVDEQHSQYQQQLIEAKARQRYSQKQKNKHSDLKSNLSQLRAALEDKSASLVTQREVQSKRKQSYAVLLKDSQEELERLQEKVRKCKAKVAILLEIEGQLHRYVAKLHSDFCAFFRSWRWRIGNLMVRGVELIRFQPRVRLASDRIQSLLREGSDAK